MKKKQKNVFVGYLFPNAYNSDGKTVKFSLHCPDGESYLVNGDHLLQRMRKLSFSSVLIHGNFNKFSQDIINAQKVFSVDYHDSSSISYDDDIYPQKISA